MSKNFTRAQIGQALECAYIEASELEEVIDNVLVMLCDAWDEGVTFGHNTDGRLIDKREQNPYEEDK